MIDASLKNDASVLQVRTPSCAHRCSYCSHSPPRWVSSSSFQINASSCLSCQLFACEECSCSASSSPVPFPSVLSLLPPIQLQLLQPVSAIASAICVITFSSMTAHTTHPHPLLLALFASSTCPYCQKHPPLTVFIYAEKEISESEPFREFQRCLPAERIVVIPVVPETAPLLR